MASLKENSCERRKNGEREEKMERGEGEQERRVSTAQYIKGIMPLSASTGEGVGGSNWPELRS